MYFSQVGNGILLPVILIMMYFLINNKDVMGEYMNNKLSNISAFLTISVVIILNLVMVFFSFFNSPR
jgi:Mn2+/Fe2+ NRAMP family transporter